MSYLNFKYNANPSEGSVIYVTDQKTGFDQHSFVTDTVYFERKASEEGNSVVTTTHKGNVVITVFLNKKDENTYLLVEDVRRLGAKVTGLLNAEKVEVVSFVSDVDPALNAAFLEGLILANYRYEKFKTKKTEGAFSTVSIAGDALDEATVNELTGLAEGVFLARDLVNEPVITLNAEAFSKAMKTAGDDAGYKTTVLDKSAIEALKMGGLLGVNKGSIDPPTFNILEWKPENAVNERPLVLVGKGVVYDTGGNNLKPGGYMSTMKCDMGGGAAVTGSLYAISKNKLPLWVIGLVPATDNRIGKNALVADDVITISDGTTVEVKNTDAEGRLILSDALVYAKKYNPELVIDMATLTGAADAITGPFGIAMVHDADEDQVKLLSEAGDEVYERLAQLPFWREFDDLLKSDIADISNLGGPKGGATTAGKFLHHFTDYNWIHLDIAGPAFLDKPSDYKTVGGTGVGVRLMYEFAQKMAKK